MHLDKFSENIRKEAVGHLDAWVNLLIDLERNYFKSKTEVSNKDVGFLKVLGESLFHLNVFSSIIVTALLNKHGELSDELKAIGRYIRFFNNLIASKMKYFFFREVPVINTNSPFFEVDVEIYQSAKNVYANVFCDTPNVKELKTNVAKLYYYSGLLYSFVFDKDTDKGVFINYKYDKEAFKTINNKITEKIKDIKTESELRVFGSKFFVNYALYHLLFYGMEKIDQELKSKIYKQFCKLLSENKDTYAEPMTSHLADIIWKFDGMLHDDDEVVDARKKVVHENDIVNTLVIFISRYLNQCTNFYAANNLDYEQMFETINDFIDQLYNKILIDKSIDEIISAFTLINNMVLTAKTSESIDIDTSYHANNDLVKTLSNLRSKDESFFKLESLLNTLQVKEFSSLLSLVAKTYHKDILLDENTEFVGFYKAGIFIAHFMNMILGTNKPVWLFKTKPYVAIHPIHSTHGKNIKTILAFDESYKTGFTHSLYESYITRNMPLVRVNTTLCTLFKFNTYSGIPVGSNTKISSAIELNDKLIPVNISDILFIARSEYPPIEYQIKDVKSEEIIDAIREATLSNGRLDLTFILSNTPALLYFCNKFTNIITSKLRKEKSIFLFSPSPDGEILCLFTQYILKTKGYHAITSANEFEFCNSQKVAMDLSVDTGFSLNYRWWVTQNDYYAFEKHYSAVKEFDLVLAIAGRKYDYENMHIMYEMR